MAVKDVLESFHLISGLKVNYDKSMVYRVGSAKKANAKYFSLGKLKWSDKIQMLGIVICDNQDEMIIRLNIEPTIEKGKAVLAYETYP